MDVHPQILIFGVSLITILVVTGVAVLLRLGGSPALANAHDAVKAAGEVADGYEPVETVIDADGTGALLKDAADRIMVIKRHGNRFAGRILAGGSSAHHHGNNITVASGEARFGTVTLSISDAASWAEAINRLSRADNA